MFIETVKNSGKDYLRLVSSIRVENKDGYKVSQKKVILNIDPLARYDDGKPNYLERLNGLVNNSLLIKLVVFNG